MILPQVQPAPEEKAPEAPAAEEKPQAPIKPEILYEDFEKLDLRLARIVACEEVKKSKKLLKLTVRVGNEERTIASGIKKWYKPEDLLGKTVVIVANLKPVTMCGVESKGMILAASDAGDEHLSVIGPYTELPDGCTVR